jgi:hypothetical protein
MKLRQQILRSAIEDTASQLSITKDQAMVRLVYSLISGEGLASFDEADVVDGAQDKQIDVIAINEDGDSGQVYILQAKQSAGFSSNALIQMRNGLDWIFKRPRAELKSLTNTKLRDKIEEYRSLQSRLSPSNIDIVVCYATVGFTKDISAEFQQERRRIEEEYDNQTFSSFKLRILGATELVDEIQRSEKKAKRIDADIKIQYDRNTASLLQHSVGELKGWICTCPADEIARIVNADPKGFIFDANIRRFLGTKKAVNDAILSACTDDKVCNWFWFLNNGITIVCDSCELIPDDNAIMRVRNMQIVNGCQTATVLAHSAKQGGLRQSTKVLLRIYQTGDVDLAGKIVVTTNNQNRISDRNLRANDQVQLDMEKAFHRYGFLYERKPGQFDRKIADQTQQIIPNELVGQCYLAMAMKRPSDARRRKYKIWEEYYGDIFSGQSIEPHILCTKVYLLCKQWLQNSKLYKSQNFIKRKLARNGGFYLARAVVALYRGTDEWKVLHDYEKQINSMSDDPVRFDLLCRASFKILAKAVSRPEHRRDIDNAMKSSRLDEDVTRAVVKFINRKR